MIDVLFGFKWGLLLICVQLYIVYSYTSIVAELVRGLEINAKKSENFGLKKSTFQCFSVASVHECFEMNRIL